MAITNTTRGGRLFQGLYKTIGFKSTAVTPPSLTTNTSGTTVIAVPNAALGDIVEVSFSLDLAGLIMHGYVNAAGSVTIRWLNLTGGTVTLSAGTVLGVIKSPAGPLASL